MTDQPQLILLHPADNILIAAQNIAAGTDVDLDGALVRVVELIPIGHKMARRALAAGTKITRYGAPIGSLTEGAAAGAHVHLHNLKSDYIATHDRETVTHDQH